MNRKVYRTESLSKTIHWRKIHRKKGNFLIWLIVPFDKWFSINQPFHELYFSWMVIKTFAKAIMNILSMNFVEHGQASIVPRADRPNAETQHERARFKVPASSSTPTQEKFPRFFYTREIRQITSTRAHPRYLFHSQHRSSATGIYRQQHVCAARPVFFLFTARGHLLRASYETGCACAPLTFV